MPDEWHGIVLAPGEGAAGKVLESGAAYLTNDYLRDVTLRAEPVQDGAVWGGVQRTGGEENAAAAIEIKGP